MSLRVSSVPAASVSSVSNAPRRLLPCCLAAAAALAALVAAGCSKVAPTAPSGSTITLSASPSIVSSATGSSTITAVVRKANGTPVANGTEVRFTTDLGTITPVIATTSSGGVATATLTGDGRQGKATVSALVGGGATATTLAVTFAGGAKTITVQAEPANIPATGGNTKLIALVRDATGQPAAGVNVNFTTTLGRLASGGAPRQTDVSGEATDTLIVQASDVTNQTSITVTATAAAPDGSLQTATAMVAVQNPHAATSVSVSASPGQIPASASNVKITLTAFVLNSQGIPISGALVIFSSTLGTITPTSATTDSTGVATTTLKVASVPAGTTTITVTAQSPGVGGALVSGTTTITITP